MPIPTSKLLQLFRLDALLGEEAADYKALFGYLADAKPAARTFQKGDKFVAIPSFKLSGNRASLIAFEGVPGVHPLIFDRASADAFVQDLKKGQIVATKTHAMIDFSRREAVVEMNARGARAGDIARVLEDTARHNKGWELITLELTSIAMKDFIAEIDKFERTRLASVKLARPNPGWHDDYEYFRELTERSNARTIEVAVTANRGESLQKNSGLIQRIKQFIGNQDVPVKSAFISGRMAGEEDETSISLSRFVEHHRVYVKLTPDGHVDDTDIMAKIEKYLDERGGKHSS